MDDTEMQYCSKCGYHIEDDDEGEMGNDRQDLKFEDYLKSFVARMAGMVL